MTRTKPTFGEILDLAKKCEADGEYKGAEMCLSASRTLLQAKIEDRSYPEFVKETVENVERRTDCHREENL